VDQDFLGIRYRSAVIEATKALDWNAATTAVSELADLRRRNGRLFILGLGGSAGNAGHMVNDVRKLANIEAYAPTDNVSELTARINDDGWGNAFIGWLQVSRLSSNDAVFVLSVGGGDSERGVSVELVEAVDYAKKVGAKIFGIVGRDGGHTAKVGDHVIVIPTADPGLVTPISEAFQAVVWHGMITHPDLATSSAHWESLGQE
jgi:D-sedoheptulose 7-phosphate isomerase